MKIWSRNEVNENLKNAKSEYFKNGYIIIKNILDNNFIDELNKSTGVINGRTRDLWKTNKYVKDVAGNKVMMNILRNLYNDEPLPFHTISFTYGTSQSLHSDLMHFSPSEDNLNAMCGVWYALEDISEDCGPLEFYRYSHREKPILDLTKIGSYDKYTQHITKLMKDKKYKRKLATIPKGSVIIWTSNLVHGGYPVKNKKLTRKSMVTHYFFDSSKYFWRPRESTPNKKVLRFDVRPSCSKILS